MPDSATRITSRGSDDSSPSCRSRSISSVSRSRAFTPTTRAPIATARSISSRECVSTSASMPSSAAVSISRRASSSLTIARITRIASAPASRWAATCSGKTVKSLAMAGIETAARASRRWSSEPPKSRSAHSTDMHAAPPAS